ncbi:MAG: hypothetical protein OXG98_17850 [Gemmatimonadetes bacterium]|nr:hypothetical protein [Gemmatimonadota bacterium]
MSAVLTVADEGAIIDFDATLDRYRRYGSDLANRFQDGVFNKVVRTPHGPCLIALYRSGNRIEMSLRPKEAAGEPDPSVTGAALVAAKKILGLNVPLQAFYAFASEDPVLSAAVDAHRGLRPNLQVDPFEMLVASITAQQINLGFAYTVRGRLVAEYGEHLEFDGERYFAFPTPEKLAELNTGDLVPMQFSRQKERYILNLARAVRSGEIDLDGLAALDDASVQERLTALVGIGRWTADWFLARYLGRGNVIAAGDLAVKRSIERHYFEGERVSEEEIRDFAARWGDYTNLAVQYLLADYGSGGT